MLTRSFEKNIDIKINCEIIQFKMFYFKAFFDTLIKRIRILIIIVL